MANVELTLGGSKTYTINGDSDKAGTAQKIDFVCSYSTSGVLTIKMQIRPGSWNFSTNDAVAAVNYGGSKTYFKNHVSFSANKDVTTVVGSTTRTMTSAGTYTVYYDLDMYSGGWGPTPDGGWYNKSFTVYIPGIITAPSTPSFKSIGTAYGNLSGGQGDVSVSWNASSAGTGNTVRDYTIQARYPGESWYDKWTGTGTSTTLNFNGTAGSNCAISLRIRANGNAGVNSGWSTTGTAMVYTIFAPENVRYYAIEHDPNTIRGTQASGLGGGSVAQKIRLSWNASSGATGYRVRLMWRNTANTAWEEYSSNYYSTSSNYLDITLPPKSSYPGSRRNDLWINVQAYKSTPNRVTYYTSWVGPYYGFRRSATVKIYINNSWKNGSIWIFNGNKWCPASDVHIYNSGWKKSKLF